MRCHWIVLVTVEAEVWHTFCPRNLFIFLEVDGSFSYVELFIQVQQKVTFVTKRFTKL